MATLIDSLFTFKIVNDVFARKESPTIQFLLNLPLTGFVTPNVQKLIDDFTRLLSKAQDLRLTSGSVYSNLFEGYTFIATLPDSAQSPVVPNLTILTQKDGVILNLSGKSKNGQYIPTTGLAGFDYQFEKKFSLQNEFLWGIYNLDLPMKADLCQIPVPREDDWVMVENRARPCPAIIYNGNDLVINFTLPKNVDKVFRPQLNNIKNEFLNLRTNIRDLTNVSNLFSTFEIDGILVSFNVDFDLRNDKAILTSYYVIKPEISARSCMGSFDSFKVPFNPNTKEYLLSLPIQNRLINFSLSDSKGQYSYDGYLLITAFNPGRTPDLLPEVYSYHKGGNMPDPIVRFKFGQGVYSQTPERILLVFKPPQGLNERYLNAVVKSISVVGASPDITTISNGKLMTSKYLETDGLTLVYLKAMKKVDARNSFQGSRLTDDEDDDPIRYSSDFWKGYILFSNNNKPNGVVEIIKKKGSGLTLTPGNDAGSTYIQFNTPNVDLIISTCLISD